MPRSMTGFGAAEEEGPLGRFRVELRAVNARFLEVRPRIPPLLAPYEAEFRRRIGQAAHRGRLDLYVSWEASAEAPSPFRVNPGVARAYVEAVGRLRDELGLSGEVGLIELLALPGVVETSRTEPGSPELRDLALLALDRALAALDVMRRAEGEATAADVGARLDTLVKLKKDVAGRAGAVPAAAKEKLQDRLARLGVDASVDPSRLAQEIAYLADRSDIAEELARLDAHLARSREALSKEGAPMGKTLEFLAQEMHREANTMGSKTSDTDIAGWVLEMKTEIERIREQAQNLE